MLAQSFSVAQPSAAATTFVSNLNQLISETVTAFNQRKKGSYRQVKAEAEVATARKSNKSIGEKRKREVITSFSFDPNRVWYPASGAALFRPSPASGVARYPTFLL